MEISVPAATRAIEEFLRQSDEFNDDVVAELNELLTSLWYIENSQIRIQIIQTAAFNVGWLSEADL